MLTSSPVTVLTMVSVAALLVAKKAFSGRSSTSVILKISGLMASATAGGGKCEHQRAGDNQSGDWPVYEDEYFCHMSFPRQFRKAPAQS
jgi:hypothetical protein